MNNPFPIILSLKINCNILQQSKIVEIIKNTFKDMIYNLPENYEEIKNFPSPNSLKNKILIKSKRKCTMNELMQSKMMHFFKNEEKNISTNFDFKTEEYEFLNIAQNSIKQKNFQVKKLNQIDEYDDSSVKINGLSELWVN